MILFYNILLYIKKKKEIIISMISRQLKLSPKRGPLIKTKLSPRYYQTEADDKIYEELIVNNKCILKMFCGTGKSYIMRYGKAIINHLLCVYVFPSLSLIEQFTTDYLYDFPSDDILKISSETDSTTDPLKIIEFLQKKENKIICITYQSLSTLIDNLNGIKINICCYDEAHHAVGEIYQQSIFENQFCEKQIFFTATPKNANGITMYDCDNMDLNMCGKLVYDYSYFRGVMEDYLSPFEIRIDFYTENTNNSIYETISRAILESGNNRVLTFHSDVNTDSPTSVNNFINELLFIKVFKDLVETEFPDKTDFYTNIVMISLDASTFKRDRIRILNEFDTSNTNTIYIIASCETIGEGIDTKNANMCVFVDPKSSFVKIIQNIGRIVRKSDSIKSTILIPCFVDKNKYLECNNDREKCDEIIREDINKKGNFNGILNVMSALKQEDEELYNICLYYPISYSPLEIKNNLQKQGYTIVEDDNINSIIDNVEYLLDTKLDIDFDDEYYSFLTDEELILQIAEHTNICIEVHTDSFENPIEYYNSESNNGEIIRIHKIKIVNEEMDENEIIYQPIIKKCGKKINREKINKLNSKNRLNINVHTNPDIKVLWNITSNIDILTEVCSCVIDCEIIKIDTVENWKLKQDEMIAYFEKYKKRPSRTDKDPIIKQLGTWIQHQISNYNIDITQCKYIMKNKEIYTLWTATLKTYKQYLVIDLVEKWKLKQDEMIAYFEKYKKRPVDTDKNPIIKQLGYWIQTQITNYNIDITQCKYIMKNEEIYTLWTATLDTYKKYLVIDLVEKWKLKQDEMIAYFKKNTKRPAASDKDDNIRQLGGWVRIQLKNYNIDITQCKQIMKNKKIHTLWSATLKTYKQYLGDAVELWKLKQDEMINYLIKYTKRPSTIDKDPIIKQLATWVTNQLSNYNIDITQCKQIMKNEEIYNLWRETLDTYKKYLVIDLVELWKLKQDEMIAYFKKYKKRPSTIDKDPIIKQLASWIHHQLQNYNIDITQCKHIMKNKEIYTLWRETLEKYKDIFNLKKIEEGEEEIIIFIPKKKQKKSMSLSNTKSKKGEKKETEIEQKKRVKSTISLLHQKYKSMTSQNLNTLFKEDKSLWKTYHEISKENEKTFPEEEIPRNKIIVKLNKIKTKRTKKVVDMGCGEGQISRHFNNDSRFEFINYDHISDNNDLIIECDISNVPKENDTVEIVILSLAMWGSNCKDYIKEASRILESDGKLYIIEPTKRWSSKDENDNIIEGEEGKKLRDLLEENGFNIIESDINKFCLFVCYKI